MKIKSNKGFTLLEVLVAIFIFTTVIFIGYKIIDKSTIAVKDQGNINKGQLTMNDMNNYLTKDLEQSEKVEIEISEVINESTLNELSNENAENLEKIKEYFINFINNTSKNKSIQYTYIIKSKNDIDATSFSDQKIISKYITQVKYNENKYIYTISRVDCNNTKIDFISNESLTEINTPPFTIEGSNPYKVNMKYNGKANKEVRHEFEVTSRLNETIGEPDDPLPLPPTGEPDDPLPLPPDPEIDDLIQGNNGYISFEYGNFGIDESYGTKNDEKNEIINNGNLRVSVGGANEESIMHHRVAYQLGNKDISQISIDGIIRPVDNNGKVLVKIDKYGVNYRSDGNGNGFAQSEYFGKNNNINSLNIVVTEGTRLLDFKINDKYYVKNGIEYKKFESGKYILTNQMSFNDKIHISGIMEKKSNDGAVIVTFGTAKINNKME